MVSAMDLQELADLLRLQKRSLYQQIYLGTLDVPHMKRGKKYLFPTKETAEYLENQIQK
jgi:hypothetical protein